jgi:hypothetical protein
MSGLLDNTQSRCDHFQEWLEESRSPQSGLESYENLMSNAGPEVRQHAQECSDCRDAAEDIVALRNLVREFEAAPVAGPWFAPRVLAVINSLEAERSRASAIWLAVPRFASRLSWLAAVALLFTCTWMYKRSTQPIEPQTASAFTSEHLFDPPALPANHDDVLVNQAGSNR